MSHIKRTSIIAQSANYQIRTMQVDEYTPIQLLYATHAIGILESVNIEGGRSRYSIILVKESFRLLQENGKIYTIKDSVKKPYTTHSDFLDALAYFSDQHKEILHTNISIPFPSGGLGYLSFEYAKYCDSFTFAPQKNDLCQPEALFYIPQTFIVCDHVKESLFLVALQYLEYSLSQPLTKILDNLESLITTKTSINYSKTKTTSTIIENEDAKESYCNAVKHIKKRIVDGYLFQAVPSRRVKIQSNIDPKEAYRLLRYHNPSPYLFYFDFKDHCILGSSPESHIKSLNNKVIVTPIAGTRRRGISNKEDMILAHDLIHDEKECAEHLMLVDLARNDIGRVCTAESIEVKNFMSVKYFSKVMHIISEVHGTLQKGKTGIDALKMTFPTGTISGAPKIQAVYEITHIEPICRGFYSGIVGYITPNKDLDTCITLRSMLYKNGHYYLQAGAGIVFDSIPEKEFEETQYKISALIQSLNAR